MPNNSIVSRIQGLFISQQDRIKSLSVMVFVQFLVAGIGVITQVTIANNLGIENYGLVAFGMTVATYGAIFSRFGLDKTLVRDLIHYPDRYAAIVKSSLMLRAVALVFLVAGVLLWKILSFPVSGPSWGVIMIIIANMFVSLDLVGVFDSRHKSSQHALYFLYQKCLYFTVIWLLFFVDASLLSINSIGMTMCITIFFYLYLQYSWVFKRLSDNAYKENIYLSALSLFRKNIYVWVSALGLLCFGPLNQLLLIYYYGADSLGGYAVAWMLVTLATILITQVARLGNSATAQITTGSSMNTEKKRFLFKYIVMMVVVTVPVAIPAIFAPSYILELVFRPEYVSAAPVLQIMGFYLFVVAVDVVATQYVISLRKEKEYLVSVLTAAIVSIILCLFFIPASGAIGAAWALVVSHGLLVTFYLALIARSFKVEKIKDN